MKKLYLLLTFFLFFISIHSQNQEWIYYTLNQAVYNIAIEEDFIWIPSHNGLIRINRTTWESYTYKTNNSGLPSNSINYVAIDNTNNKWIGHPTQGLTKFDGLNWTNYNTTNSGIPDNWVSYMAFDDSDNIWFASNGLTKFDGSNWVNYNSSNSGLPDNWIYSLAIDSNNNKWVGTYDYGVTKFDGSDWIVYDTNNSGLPNNWVYTIAFEDSNLTWLGTFAGGLTKFDGVSWNIFNTFNSGLPHDSVLCLAIDYNGNKWIGTDGGLVKFNDNDWTLLNTSNSGLPNDQVFAIIIDEYGNKIIGTFTGLVFYNEGGVVNVDKDMDISIPGEYMLSQNYPNPFNPSTIISYQLPEDSQVQIKIYDIMGREIIELVNEYKRAGYYKINFNAVSLSTGIYLYKINAGKFSNTRKMLLVK